jgi:hypothetical protein
MIPQAFWPGFPIFGSHVSRLEMQTLPVSESGSWVGFGNQEAAQEDAQAQAQEDAQEDPVAASGARLIARL